MDKNLSDWQGTLMEALEIKAVELTAEKVVLTMPIGPKTRQPMGMLHGGASLALAETAASTGAFLHIDPNKEAAVGMEINANHLRSGSDGVVTAVAVPLHKGSTSMVWEINITDERDRLLCVSRCTIAILKKRIKH